MRSTRPSQSWGCYAARRCWPRVDWARAMWSRSNVPFITDVRTRPSLEMVDTSDKLPREQEGVLWVQRGINSRMSSSGRRLGCWQAAGGLEGRLPLQHHRVSDQDSLRSRCRLLYSLDGKHGIYRDPRWTSPNSSRPSIVTLHSIAPSKSSAILMHPSYLKLHNSSHPR
jgi:hypothetical protein